MSHLFQMKKLLLDWLQLLIKVSIDLTDYFLDNIVDGIRNDAILKQKLQQGISSDRDFCEYLCGLKQSIKSLCAASLFGNETHANESCIQLIHNSVNEFVAVKHDEVSAHRFTFMAALFVVLGFFTLIAGRSMVKLFTSVAHRIVIGIYNWIRKPTTVELLSLEVEKTKAEVDLIHWKEIKTVAEETKRISAERMANKIVFQEYDDTDKILFKLQVDKTAQIQSPTNEESTRQLRSRVAKQNAT
jgi:hypothetical protein